MNNSLEKLYFFLEKHKVNNKIDPYTHTSIHPPLSYKIDQDIDVFFTLYQNCVYKKRVFTITERPLGFGPLRIDFDLKAELSVGLKRQYTSEIVTEIIKEYQRLISQLVKNPEQDVSICVLLEKPEPRRRDDLIIDGFHLHFPNFVCESWIADGYLKKEMTEFMKSAGLWKNTKYIESPDKFIDQVFNKNWLMYGSAKAPELKPFLISKVFRDGIEISIEEAFKRDLGEKTKKISYYLPWFLSIKRYKEITEIKTEILEKRILFSVVRKRNFKIQTRRTEDVIRDLKTIKEGRIMEMISERRADNYSEWMDIGWSLYNIGDGCEEALQMWIDFSKKSDKFKDGKCEELWDKMEVKNKTIGSLLFVAKEDSPQDYFDWKRQNIDFLINESIKSSMITEYDVSLVVCKILENRFVCAGSKHNLWFEFFDGRWTQIEDAVSIKKLLPVEVCKEYERYRSKLYLQEREDEDDHDKVKLLIRRCTKIIESLKTCLFQDKIIKMCKTLSYNCRFLDKLDETRTVFGCENGVFDLELCIFRQGRHEDYLSFSCKHNYRQYSFEDEEIIELLEILEKIITNKNVREYFLDFTATLLKGGNDNKIFMMFLGPTNGGKSTIVDLIYSTFGDYAKIFPREFFIKPTFQQSSSSVRPEIVTSKGKRVGLGHELTKEDKCNLGEMKMFSGNDTITARTFYKEPIEFKPQVTFISQMNSIIQIPAHDTAMWERCRIIYFDSKFSDNPPKDEKDQKSQKHFKKDLSLKDRIQKFSEPFLWLLFERYKKLYFGTNKTKLTEPGEVKLVTEKYREQSNVYKIFIKEKTEKSETSSIKLADLFSIFKDWYLENYPSYKEKIGKLAFKEEISKELGVCVGNKYDGYKIINVEDSDFKN